MAYGIKSYQDQQAELAAKTAQPTQSTQPAANPTPSQPSVGGGVSAPAYTPTRWNPGATPEEQLAHFSQNQGDAFKELALIKQMTNGASADKISQISDWANQIRAKAGISATDATFGNDPNVDANVQSQNVQNYLNGLSQPQGSGSETDKMNQAALQWAKDFMAQGMSQAQAQYAALQAARNAQKAGLFSNLKSMYDQNVAGQKAQLDASKVSVLADLKKTYEDAVSRGEMSVNQAKDAYNQQAAAIDQQSYLDAEGRNLSAQQRGIGNSQQLLGMQATDAAKSNNLKNGNMTQRDMQIADIRSRISNLTTQKGLDEGRINETYNANLARNQADANSAYLQGVNQINMGDYNNDSQFGQGMIMQGMNNNNDLAKMQFGAMNQQSAALQGQQFDLQKMQVAQNYNVDNMNQQQKNQLGQMAAAFGYDIQKMDKQQINQLVQMAAANGYDLNKMGVQQGYDMTKIGAQGQNQLALQKAKLDTANKQADNDYQAAVQRELSKYSPGTSEYSIRLNQLSDAQNQAKAKNQAQFEQDIAAKNALNNPFLQDGLDGKVTMPSSGGGSFGGSWNGFWSGLFGNGSWSGGANQSEVNTYNAKRQAIIDYNNMLSADSPARKPVPAPYTP